MGKKAIIASLILISLLFVMLDVEVVKADPIPFPPTPNQEQPAISVQSPLNSTNYNSTICLNFSVTAPSSWDAMHMVIHYIGEMRYANVTLDGKLNNVFELNSNGTESLYANLYQVSSGAHMLNVTVMSCTYYVGPLYGNFNGTHGTYDGKPIYEFPIVVSDTVYFTVNATKVSPAPAMESPFAASLSESASALNYGNTINFNVTVEGGVPPYNFTWNLDGQSLPTTNAPYFYTNSSTVGSHYVFVEVKDADSNTAKTLTVEFNVLPSPTSILSPSASPTQEPTPTFFLNDSTPTPSPSPTATMSNITVGVAVAIGLVVVAAILLFYGKNRKTSNSER